MPRRAPVAVLAGLSIASVILAEFWIPIDPAGAFYLLPTRIAELGLGGLLVWALRFRPAANAALEVMLLAGLALIAWACLNFTDRTPFPGLNALVPCLGAALAIAACTARHAGAVLRAAPVVWIGRISYSLYLVHWPIIVFWRSYLFADLEGLDRWAVIALSIALAALQYSYVEERWRHGARTRAAGLRFLGGAAATALSARPGRGCGDPVERLDRRIPADRYVMSNRDQRHTQDRQLLPEPRPGEARGALHLPELPRQGPRHRPLGRQPRQASGFGLFRPVSRFQHLRDVRAGMPASRAASGAMCFAWAASGSPMSASPATARRWRSSRPARRRTWSSPGSRLRTPPSRRNRSPWRCRISSRG